MRRAVALIALLLFAPCAWAAVDDATSIYRRLAPHMVWLLLGAAWAIHQRARKRPPPQPPRTWPSASPPPDTTPHAPARPDPVVRKALRYIAGVLTVTGLYWVHLHHLHASEQAAYRADSQAGFERSSWALKQAEVAGEQPGAQLLIDYASAAWGIQRRDLTDQALARLEQLQPHDGPILSQMGWLYISEKRMPEAWAAVRRGANLDSTWSQYSVGKTLYLGCDDIGQPPDRDAAMVWFRRAAALGNDQAGKVVRIEAWGRAFAWVYLMFS